MSEFTINKPSYVSEREVSDTRKNLNVPLSINLDDAINVVIKDRFVIDIPIIIHNQKVNFLDVNITDNITISGLALRIFLNNYYNNNILVVNKSSVYRDIKQGYYGGITKVYKPYGRNLFYYDVNYLYPFVALQDMAGLNCSTINKINV